MDLRTLLLKLIHGTIKIHSNNTWFESSSYKSRMPNFTDFNAISITGGFSTMNPIRTKGRVAQLKTPSVELNGSTMITPKFDPATPLHRTAMRTQKAGEKFLVSMDGSPVYVGGRGGSRSKNENLIPVPIGKIIF